ncbi:MAG: hypothetical protein ACI8Z7_000293 [Candidatus Nanohaloarchaea archaeon]|jgi:hypothetical protein
MNREVTRYTAIALVVLFWLLTPLYLQMEHGYSAIKVSFGITVFYYLVFRLWKFQKTDSEQS